MVKNVSIQTNAASFVGLTTIVITSNNNSC